MDPNEKGTIYFGAKLDNVSLLDRNGITKPIERKGEKYISVSLSGYSATLGIDVHEEIKSIARSLVEDGHATIIEGRLVYNTGYQHSLTAYHGFGPSQKETRNVLSNADLSTRAKSNITAVIPASFGELLCGPTITTDSDFFAYCSLALHEFISRIDSGMICGWIVSKGNAESLLENMNNGLLCRREVWCVEDV